MKLFLARMRKDVEDADKKEEEEEITNLGKKRVMDSSHLSIDDTTVRNKKQKSNSESWVGEKTNPMSRKDSWHALLAAFELPPQMGRLVTRRTCKVGISTIEDQVGTDTDSTEGTIDDDNVDEYEQSIPSYKCDVREDNATTTTAAADGNVDEGEQPISSLQDNFADSNMYNDDNVDEGTESIPCSCQCIDDESMPCSLCNMLWPKKMQSLIQHEKLPPCNYFPMGFEWDDGYDYHQWLEMYDQLRFSKSNDTDSKKVASNSKENINLRNWTKGQRILYKNDSLSTNRIYLLECIEFDWKRPENEEQTEWMEMFERLVRYKKRHSCVSSNYNEDPKLRTWMYTQRCSCAEQYRIDLLNQFDFEWKVFS